MVSGEATKDTEEDGGPSRVAMKSSANLPWSRTEEAKLSGRRQALIKKKKVFGQVGVKRLVLVSEQLLHAA